MMRCKVCGSSDLQQRATIWLNPHDSLGLSLSKVLEGSQVDWEDAYWCVKCDAEVDTVEPPSKQTVHPSSASAATKPRLAGDEEEQA